MMGKRELVDDVAAEDIEQLKRFPCGGYCDESTIVYLQHPCVILTALEVLGFQVGGQLCLKKNTLKYCKLSSKKIVVKKN